MLDSVYQRLEKFEISHYGFLPIDEPLVRLPDSYYSPWEDIITQLPHLIQSSQFFNKITQLPLLTTAQLHTEPEWRRAYVILSFFTHAYVWSGKVPNEVLPPKIARPLLEVSEHLGLPPTATYPSLNLWNCGLVYDGADITNPENVVMRHTFTGTDDEAWFYAVSVSVEAKGIKAIQLMLRCVDAVNRKDDEVVRNCLTAFTQNIFELRAILQRMNERCEPSVFYHRIRPFLAGSRGMEAAGLPRGLYYDQGNGEGSWRQYSGGSNAQSTLIQFLDISLGVKHQGTGDKTEAGMKRRQTYLSEMRNYMPRSHRNFLDHFSTISNIQTYAKSTSTSPAIETAFDEAVDAMTAFRDTHIKIVARFVVAPSRASVATQDPSVKNIASASSETSSKKELKGTGGTNLMMFLKQTRDETKAAKEPIATTA